MKMTKKQLYNLIRQYNDEFWMEIAKSMTVKELEDYLSILKKEFGGSLSKES